MRAEDSLAGAPGSAMTTAAGLTVRKAVGASVHLASTIGKAPAALSASTRSAAGLSATRGYNLRAHDLVRKPVPIPDHIEDKLFGIMRQVAPA
jgi:hypothetical protein